MASPARITERCLINIIWKSYEKAVACSTGCLGSRLTPYEVLFTLSAKFWLEHPLFLVCMAHIVKKGASRSSQDMQI